LLLDCTKNSFASVLHISKRKCTQEHLNHDVLSVDFYDDITGDSKQRSTVLRPVKQLNVSYLLITDLRLVVLVLVFLSDVLGVEVFLLAPTVSGGDGAGLRFCAPLPPSPPSFPPRFFGIALKTLDEFP
jgi:hypothetical protein